MNIDAITAIAPNPISEGDVLHQSDSIGSSVNNPVRQFGQIVNQGLESINQSLVSAQTDLQRLATGDVQNLHQIMIRMEESRLSFQLFLQVRNRLLEAYQDIMKMQV